MVEVVAERIVADSKNTSEKGGGGELVIRRGVDDEEARLEKRSLGNTQGDSWGPTRIDIRRKNRCSILRVRTYRPHLSQRGVSSRTVL